MPNIALAHTNDNAIVEFAPASSVVSGKTMTERKLSVLAGASFEAVTYLAGQNGKVGKTARDGLAMHAEGFIASAARRGNYKPLCEALAGLLGESVSISNRASYEGLVDRFNDRLMDLSLAKNGGYTVDKKTGLSKPNAKRAVYSKVIMFVQRIQQLATQAE
jgi:hypothetical protein